MRSNKVPVHFFTPPAPTEIPITVRFARSDNNGPFQRWFSNKPWPHLGTGPLTAQFHGWLLLAILGLFVASPVFAQTVTFDFDTDTPALTSGQNVPFDQSSGGVTAHFSAATGG
ncbi:MAG TPA: hypothetical protein VJA21_19735, partial [Verrucomicrobiae bacterium]